jgi:hypothetical protein
MPSTRGIGKRPQLQDEAVAEFLAKLRKRGVLGSNLCDVVGKALCLLHELSESERARKRGTQGPTYREIADRIRGEPLSVRQYALPQSLKTLSGADICSRNSSYLVRSSPVRAARFGSWSNANGWLHGMSDL